MKTIAFILVLSFFASCSSVGPVGNKSSPPRPNTKHAAQDHDIQKHPENHDVSKRTVPEGKTGKIISREGYVLQYNKDCKIAHWTSYEILSESLIENVKRNNDDFAPDELLDSEQASLDDYDEPIYDRGHLARAHLFTKSAKLMSESFRLSNIVPQDAYMNREGAWRQAEEFEYQVANNSDKIFVVSGPIVSSNSKVIGFNRVCVPESVFKIIFNPQTHEGIGFIIPNHKEKNNFKYYVKTIDEVELATGLDFFHELDDSIEAEIENEYNISNWHFSNIHIKKHQHQNEDYSSSLEDPLVKKDNKSGICHNHSSRYYTRTTHFESFRSIDECIQSGGRLPL